jgi:hypothetical protein
MSMNSWEVGTGAIYHNQSVHVRYPYVLRYSPLSTWSSFCRRGAHRLCAGAGTLLAVGNKNSERAQKVERMPAGNFTRLGIVKSFCC